MLAVRPADAYAAAKINKALGQESFRNIREARKQLDSIDVPLRTRKFEEVQVSLSENTGLSFSGFIFMFEGLASYRRRCPQSLSGRNEQPFLASQFCITAWRTRVCAYRRVCIGL